MFGREEMFHIPQVLLDVLPCNIPFVIDEITYVEKLIFLSFILSVAFNNRTGNNTCLIVSPVTWPFSLWNHQIKS